MMDFIKSVQQLSESVVVPENLKSALGWTPKYIWTETVVCRHPLCPESIHSFDITQAINRERGKTFFKYIRIDGSVFTLNNDSVIYTIGSPLEKLDGVDEK